MNRSLRLICLLSPSLAFFVLLARSAYPAPTLVADLGGAPGITAAAPAPLDSPTSTGLAVSTQTGDFTYTYPIKVPPGRLGVEPKLAITYRAGGAVLGGIAAGWSLDIPFLRWDPTQSELAVAQGEQRRWVSDLAGGQRLEAVVEPGDPQYDYYRAQHDATYTRYKRQYFNVWEADNGSVTMGFGEPNQIEPQGLSILLPYAPLTSLTDDSGNRANYYWRIEESEDGARELLLDSIEYTVHPDIPSPHAVVTFEYGSPSSCPGANALSHIGSRVSARGGVVMEMGASPLRVIRRSVRDAPGGSLREVRRTELLYDSSAESCDQGTHGPRRQLSGLRETGTSVDGVVTTLPATRFEYAQVPLVRDDARPGQYSTANAWGEGLPELGSEAAFRDRGATLNEMRMDMDGDGVVDKVSIRDSATCEFQWESRVHGENKTVVFRAPMLPWRSNRSNPREDMAEGCWLNMQFTTYYSQRGSDDDGRPGGLNNCGNRYDPGAALMNYRFLDMNRDGRPDLVTWSRHVPDALDTEQLGLSVPGYWEKRQQGFDCYTERQPHQVVQQGWPNGPSWYVYRWYRNTGEGFEPDAHVELSPVELASAGTDNFVRGVPLGVNVTIPGATTATTSGLMDLDGDGYLDAIRTDGWAKSLGRSVPTGVWYVWPGGPNGWPDQPYEWPAPGYVLGITYFEDDADHTLSESQVGMFDINGDGLLDYIEHDPGTSPPSTTALINCGSSFCREVEVGLQPLWKLKVDKTGAIQTRVSINQTVDLDGDGLPDFVRDTSGGDPGDSPLFMVRMNTGSGWLGALHGPLRLASDTNAGPRQLVAETDARYWYAHGAWLDADADGSADYSQGTTLSTAFDTAKRGVLNRVTNPWGGETEIEYAPATDGNTVTGDTAAGVGRWVVKQITQGATAAAPQSVVTYQYERPVINSDSYGATGFRGFERVVETDPLGARTEYDYDYEQRWDGLLTAQVRYFADGSAHSVLNRWYESFDLFAGAISTVHLAAEVTYLCDNGDSVDLCLNDPEPLATRNTWKLRRRVGASPSEEPIVVVKTQEQVGVLSGFDVKGLPRLEAGYRSRTMSYDIAGSPTRFDIMLRSTKKRQHNSLAAVLFGYEETVYDDHARPIRARVLLDDKGQEAGLVDATVVGTFAETRISDYKTTGQVAELLRPVQVAALLAGDEPAVQSFSYDDFDLYADSVVDEVGRRTRRTLDVGTGLEIGLRHSVIGVNALEPYTITMRDGFGRPLVVVRQSQVVGQAWPVVATSEYVDQPTPRVITRDLIDYAPGDRYRTTTTDYDAFGRLAKKQVEGRDPVSYQYDPAGNLAIAHAPNPRVGANADAEYRFMRDSLGRIERVLRPLQAPDVTTYRRRRVVHTQDVSNSTGVPSHTEFYYDSFGRLAQVVESASQGASVVLDAATTSYEYDPNDNLQFVTNADGIVTQLDHDFAGRRVRIERDGAEWSYLYDLDDNMVAEVLPDAAINPLLAPAYTNTWVYDAGDRIESAHVGSGGTAGTLAAPTHGDGMTRYYYEGNPHGAQSRVELPYGSIDYTYTVEGWLETETRAFSVDTGSGPPIVVPPTTQRYAYNALGEVVEADNADHPSDPTSTRWHYDSTGAPDWVAEFATGGNPDDARILARLSYTRAGYIDLRTDDLPSGGQQRHRFEYDDAGRLDRHQIEADVCMPAPFCTIWFHGGEDPQFDGVNNVAWVDDLARGRRFDFAYDAQHQLTGIASSEPGLYDAEFHYSGAGRIDSVTVNSSAPGVQVAPDGVVYDYSPTPSSQTNDEAAVHSLINAASGLDVASFAYDAAGNLLSRDVEGNQWAFTYDARGNLRLARHADTGATEIYLYDQNRQRILAFRSAFDGEEPRLRHWFGAAEAWYGTNSEPLSSELHIKIASAPVAKVVNGERANPEHLYANALGHVLAILDESGLVIGSFAYSPYGDLLDANGAAAGAHRRRFNGKEDDALTNLVYYGYRYYDRYTRTWTSQDPLYQFAPDRQYDDPRRMGLYTFSMNNPVVYVDADGRETGTAYRAVYEATGGKAHIQPSPKCLDETACRRLKYVRYGIAAGLGLMLVGPLVAAVPEGTAAVGSVASRTGTAVRTGVSAGANTAARSGSFLFESVVEGAVLAGGGYGAWKVLGDSASDVWSLPDTKRGEVIEAQLAASEYADWWHIGAERNGYMELIDFQRGRTVVSLKTVNTTGSSWRYRMQNHLLDLAYRPILIDGEAPARRILDLRVQPGGAADAAYLVDLANALPGVTVRVSEYK